MKPHCFLLVTTIALIACSCGGGGEDKPNGPITPANVAVTSVSLSKTSAELIIGNTLQLTATVSPSNASDKTITWSSSSSTVASVSPTGLVTAIAEGSSNITASCGGKSATCKLTVKKPTVAVTSVELDKTEITLEPEETYTLKATVKPDNATDKTITWASSKPDIATVDNNGKVTSVKEGSTTITAKSGEKTASCIVNVLSKTAVPLTFTASGSVHIKLDKGILNENPEVKRYYEYRINGEDWKIYSWNYINLTNGQKVSFRAKSNNYRTGVRFVIGGGGTVAASGNVMFLLKKEGDLTSVPSSAFLRLFADCTALTTAPELPATTLDEGCYERMFFGCTNLKTAPKLPATKMSWDCYARMFEGCTGLSTAPELPARTATQGCYKYMFRNCTALTTAPKLPATSVSDSCYKCMFEGCKSLKKAPELPATKLGVSCYERMFRNCTALTTAPKLPATTLVRLCYKAMFAGCTHLTTAPELPATTMAPHQCYYQMFISCTALTTAPELPATTLQSQCYALMFYGCSSLTTAPVILATTLEEDCYRRMFYGCTNLKTAPELPVTTLKNRCYYEMFTNCTSLKTAPTLPAKTIVLGSYDLMFDGCINLNYIKCLATRGDITEKPSCLYWVRGVASSGTFIKASSSNWSTGTSGIPKGWTVVNQ